MLLAGVVLYILAGLGSIAMGIRYISATAPIGYHREILEGESPGPITIRVLDGVYKIMGSSFLTLGVTLVLVTWFGVSADLLWAKIAALLGGLLAGGTALLIALRLERETRVRTPWRIAAIQTGLILAAFVLSVL